MAITIDQLNIELTADSKTASSAIDQLAKNLERLKTAYANTALEEGKNSKSAKDLKKEYDDLERELGESKKALDDVEKEFRESGDAAEKSGEKVSKFSKLGWVDNKGNEQDTQLWYNFIQNSLHHEGILQDNIEGTRHLAKHYTKYNKIFPHIIAYFR